MRNLRLLVPFFLFFIFFAGKDAKDIKVCLKKVCLRAEIADSDIERSQGLMFRENLAEGKGMLFIFEEENDHGFWMKNMRFPLDIIWIGANKKVVDIIKEAFPCQREPCISYAPEAKAKYVLEVPAGFIENNNIGIGDKIRW